MGLLERAVIALETIAGTEYGKVGLDQGQFLDTAEELSNSSPVGTSLPTAGVYEKLCADGKRDALLKLCAEKEITVAPRTRIDTLVKMLTSYDEANSPAVNVASETAAEEATVDPFASAEIPVTKGVTLPMIREVLQEMHAKQGLERVVEVLAEFGGNVQQIKEIAPEHFAGVYAEAIKK